MEMLQQMDVAHFAAMGKIQKLMRDPEAMKEWFESKKKEFEALPDEK